MPRRIDAASASTYVTSGPNVSRSAAVPDRTSGRPTASASQAPASSVSSRVVSTTMASAARSSAGFTGGLRKPMSVTFGAVGGSRRVGLPVTARRQAAPRAASTSDSMGSSSPQPQTATTSGPSPGIVSGAVSVTGRSGSGSTRLRVAIVAANAFQFDARLLRAASALAEDGHRVTVVALAGPRLPRRETLGSGIELVRLPLDRRITSALRPLPQPIRRLTARLLGLDPEAVTLSPARPAGLDGLRAPLRRLLEIVAHTRRATPWTDRVVEAVPDADVFHAKALICLPVIREAARRTGGRFVYDVADIHTEAARLARMPALVRSVVRGREQGWVAGAAGITAVSEAVAAEAARLLHVPPPVVVLNCPPIWRPDEPDPPTSTRLRDATGVRPDQPIVLYQGGFSVDRGIEELAAALDERLLADIDAVAVFLGYGRLQDWLVERAASRPGRLFVLPAVPVAELLEWTASADVSFVGQPPRTLNQRLNLANKLFESMMVGVPVIVAARTEQCRLVGSEAVGLCCDVDSPAAIAAAIARLLGAPVEERQRLRAHCRRLGLERYNWQVQRRGLVELYRRLGAPEGRP
jgi:glycosyltransferase involved in cell wall biosynthesis